MNALWWQGRKGGSASPDLQAALDAKQATLVSGTTIKTVNGQSLLGSGNITVTAEGATLSDVIVYAIALGG